LLGLTYEEALNSLTERYNFFYTIGMKTAISIPDTVYESAEKLGHRLGESRSELYTKAVRSYIEKHQDKRVTEKLNEVYSTEASKLDPVLADLQTQSWIKNNPW
jgi:metal-responsive CopG/Arc/MetJ family transcriptional regulator